MAIADGACAARSRREEEGDALPSSTTTNEEIARNPRLPNGSRARVRTQTLSCADEHLRYIQFDLWAQQLSCYFGIDHLVFLFVRGTGLVLSQIGTLSNLMLWSKSLFIREPMARRRERMSPQRAEERMHTSAATASRPPVDEVTYSRGGVC